MKQIGRRDNMKDFDKQIEQAFKQKLIDKTEPLQDDIWTSLETELFHKTAPKGEVRKMNRKTRMLSLFVAIAAAFFIIFSLQTKQGAAIIGQIKDFFAPEKEITQSIEGQDEQTDVTLHEGTNVEYIIYIDESRYKMVKGEETDIITTIDPLPENYPPVSLEIKQIADQKPEVVLQELEVTLKQNFPELRSAESVTEPVDGYLLHGINGNEPTSKVVHAYVISNGKEGSFILQGNYFLEAAEGHGARFHHMLESFEIVEE